MSAITASLQRGMIYRLVALGFVVMFLATGIKSLYQVYFTDLAQHFGTGRASFAWSGSLFMLATGLMSPLTGAMCDRIGPLRTLLVGAVAGGASLVLAALFSASLPVFVVAYGAGAAFALAAMTYVPMGMLVDRLFEQRSKGLAYAVVTNGSAVGFIVLSPFWIWLQPQVDWSDAFLLMGLLLAGPTASLVWWAARASATLDLAQPTPTAKHKATTAPRDPPLHAGPAARGAWRQVLGDPMFYVLALGFLGCGATMAFIDVHLVPLWQDSGTSRLQMGLSLSLLGVLELVSGLATGWLAMRHSKRVLLGIFYAMRTLAMLLLLNGDAGVHTLGFAAVFGASYLGTVVLTSMYCFERYGPAVKGRAFGLLFLVHQLGAFVSVQAGAWAYDDAGSYRPVVMVLAAVTAVAAVASWVFLRGAANSVRGAGAATPMLAGAGREGSP